MKEIGVCKECKFRNENGRCTSEKLDEDYMYDDDKKVDMLIYDYIEGGEFWVGENFGCIHWEKVS